MNQLTFEVCIFSGIICTSCGTALDNMDMSPRRLMQHRNSHHPHMTISANAQLDRVNDILNDAAKALAASNSDHAKVLFCEMFLVQSGDGLWCSHESCTRAYRNERQHVGSDRKRHRDGGHFSDLVMKYPKLPKTTTIFFTENQWNFQSYAAKFSNLFRKALDSQLNQIPVNFQMAAAHHLQVRNRIPLLQPAGNLFDADDNYVATFMLQEASPTGSQWSTKEQEFATGIAANSVAEAQSEEVRFNTAMEREDAFVKAAAVYEREHLAPRKGDHSKLLKFEEELGLHQFVTRAFGGSCPRFIQYASLFLSKPGALWEKGLEKAFFQFYYLSNQQIAFLCPELRSKLMVIGDGSSSRLLSKIAQGANEIAGMADELAEEAEDYDGADGMEAAEAPGLDMQQQYEKFTKDVIELMGAQSGYSNSGRAFLQPVRGETFKKYRRIGLLFALFMARTLEAKEDEENCNTNVRWWHRVGKPTLEKCMTKLKEQYEQQQQQGNVQDVNQSKEHVFEPLLSNACTVVMKLLLIALCLETDLTKDYEDQISANLPHCSQFLLCRTIHIDKRDDGEDDDDDNINGIDGNNDGSFIIQQTSPGRAQATAAALMNVLRVTVAAAMVHASATNDHRMQKAIWSASLFSVSRPIRDLAYRSKIARMYASIITTGSTRAEAVVDKEQGVSGWKLETIENPDLFVHKSDLLSGVRKMCNDAQNSVRKMLLSLTELSGIPAFANVIQSQIFKDEPNLVSAMSELPMALFGRPIAFEDEQSRIDFVNLTRRPTLQHPFKRQATDVYAGTIGATFFLGNNGVLDSTTLAAAITAIFIEKRDTAEGGQFLKVFDALCADLLLTVLTLLQWSVRGRPRNCDLNVTNCGSTNAYGSFVKSDFVCKSLGHTGFKNVIFARFPSLKYSGNRDRDYPWLLLPLEVARLVGIYFSICRFTQVKILEYLIDHNQFENIDFGKDANEYLITRTDAIEGAKLLLLNQLTKLTTKIHIVGSKL
jgi:hypothetical protein